MCGSVIRDRLDGSAELSNRGVEVAYVAQTLSGVCREYRGLQIGPLLGQLGTKACLFHSALSIAKLAENRGERGVSSGEVRLKTNRFAQRLSGFLQFGLLLQNGTERVKGLSVVWFRCDRFF